MLTKNIISKIDGKTYNRSNGHFTRHLRAHGITYQDYYETYITGRKEFCPYCGKPRRFVQADHTYIATCGSRICGSKQISAVRLAESPERTALADQRRRQTNIIKYGVEYVGQLDEVKQKTLATNNKEVLPDGIIQKIS